MRGDAIALEDGVERQRGDAARRTAGCFRTLGLIRGAAAAPVREILMGILVRNATDLTRRIMAPVW